MDLKGVFSDLKVMSRSTLASPTELRGMFETSAPPGYGAFRNFIPGYYSFQRALFRHTVRSTGDLPIVSGLKYSVDMPDVVDRGKATVAAGELKEVNFSKQYSTPPEVSHVITQVSEYAIVVVSEITEMGFVFSLQNAAGNKVAGSISWTSVGY